MSVTLGICSSFRRSLSRRALGLLAAVGAGLVLGYALAGGEEEAASTTFHDMRVLTPANLTALVDGENPVLVQLAGSLGSPEEAYFFVRDRIAYDPSLPVAQPDEAIAAGRASCLTKATLLASLYRALGLPDTAIRVVTGQVYAEGGLMEHAWLELEYQGQCLQQDPTTLRGHFAFDQFRGTEYARGFVRRELFCFNDKGFAVVSLSNRFRGLIDPHAALEGALSGGEELSAP